MLGDETDNEKYCENEVFFFDDDYEEAPDIIISDSDLEYDDLVIYFENPDDGHSPRFQFEEEFEPESGPVLPAATAYLLSLLMDQGIETCIAPMWRHPDSITKEDVQYLERLTFSYFRERVTVKLGSMGCNDYLGSLKDHPAIFGGMLIGGLDKKVDPIRAWSYKTDGVPCYKLVFSTSTTVVKVLLLYFFEGKVTCEAIPLSYGRTDCLFEFVSYSVHDEYVKRKLIEDIPDRRGKGYFVCKLQIGENVGDYNHLSSAVIKHASWYSVGELHNMVYPSDGIIFKIGLLDYRVKNTTVDLLGIPEMDAVSSSGYTYFFCRNMTPVLKVQGIYRGMHEFGLRSVGPEVHYVYHKPRPDKVVPDSHYKFCHAKNFYDINKLMDDNGLVYPSKIICSVPHLIYDVNAQIGDFFCTSSKSTFIGDTNLVVEYFLSKFKRKTISLGRMYKDYIDRKVPLLSYTLAERILWEFGAYKFVGAEYTMSSYADKSKLAAAVQKHMCNLGIDYKRGKTIKPLVGAVSLDSGRKKFLKQFANRGVDYGISITTSFSQIDSRLQEQAYNHIKKTDPKNRLVSYNEIHCMQLPFSHRKVYYACNVKAGERMPYRIDVVINHKEIKCDYIVEVDPYVPVREALTSPYLVAYRLVESSGKVGLYPVPYKLLKVAQSIVLGKVMRCQAPLNTLTYTEFGNNWVTYSNMTLMQLYQHFQSMEPEARVSELELLQDLLLMRTKLDLVWHGLSCQNDKFLYCSVALRLVSRLYHIICELLGDKEPRIIYKQERVQRLSLEEWYSRLLED
jgi:hypothetical protein